MEVFSSPLEEVQLMQPAGQSSFSPRGPGWSLPSTSPGGGHPSTSSLLLLASSGDVPLSWSPELAARERKGIYLCSEPEKQAG